MTIKQIKQDIDNLYNKVASLEIFQEQLHAVTPPTPCFEIKKIPLEDLWMYIIVRGDLGIPDGMAAAQAAHAAVICVAQKALKLYDEKDPGVSNEFVSDLANQRFTKIVLRCRDWKEMDHIRNQAKARGFLVAEMRDTNPGFYGDNGDRPTAIAIEPTEKRNMQDVCGYLPLW